MHIRKMILFAGMALALPCLAQGPPAGGAPGGPPGGGGGAAGGMISMKADRLVAEVNTSKTGKITKEEWKAAELADFVFTRLDTGKTGYITKEQLEDTKFPAALDTNKDGYLTVAKMIAFDKTMSGGGAPGGGAPGGGAPDGPQK